MYYLIMLYIFFYALKSHLILLNHFQELEGGGQDNCILECKEDCNPNTCCGQTNGPTSTNNKTGPIADH